MTQKDLIIQYLNDYGSITPTEAFFDLGITKLATRISEMRKDGIEFNIQEVKAKNRYGKNTRYARYSFSKREVG